jgi:hypothetical protein
MPMTMQQHRDKVDRVGEVDVVLFPDLRAEYGDHGVEDHCDCAQDATWGRCHDRPELG